jgi:hypothetical protein
MSKYFGIFTDAASVGSEFSTDDAKDEEILFAWYEYEDYSGDAFVLLRRDGVLYEVNGGHCSCYGLEGQWELEATTWEALAMRPPRYEEAANAELARLIAENAAPTATPQTT